MYENKIIRNLKNNQDITTLKKKYLNEIENYWTQRTNKPYKNILKNENYNREYSSAQDLVVHKISSKDKIKTDDDYRRLQTIIDKQNIENKQIYSAEKKDEHKKLFDIENKFKFIKEKKNEDELLNKKGKEYYRTENEKQIRDKNMVDHIINNKDMFSSPQRTKPLLEGHQPSNKDMHLFLDSDNDIIQVESLAEKNKQMENMARQTNIGTEKIYCNRKNIRINKGIKNIN